jgi:hypothetical protein
VSEESRLDRPNGSEKSCAESPVWAADAQHPSVEALPSGLLQRGLATLDPGYFALVMASGIISIGPASSATRRCRR